MSTGVAGTRRAYGRPRRLISISSSGGGLLEVVPEAVRNSWHPVRTAGGEEVELRGLEPLTSALPATRSSN